MRIFNGKLTGNTVGGTLEQNITHLNCLCCNVVVKPTNESTQYDIQIISPEDAVIYERTGEEGTLSEITSLPLKGNYTVKILNATSDEQFVICLVSREE